MLPTITLDPARTEPLASGVAIAMPCLRARAYYRPTCGPRDTHTRITPSCRGQAWRPTHGPRLPASVPIWSGPDAWLTELEAALRSPEGEKLRREAHVHVETALDVAAVDARAADRRTGRGVATAHATVATTLECSAKTVQRARTLIQALGHAITVLTGRYLTTEERAEANAHHGGHQRRMASERALLTPRHSPNVHLPRRGQVVSDVQLRSGLPKRALTRARAASRPASNATNHRTGQEKPALKVQRLAGALAQRLPWLARGHIGSLCRTLMALGLDEDGWSAHDVIDLLDQRNVQLGLYSPPSHAQRDPLALFAHQVRAALADVDEPPRRRRARHGAAQAQARAHAQAQRAAEHAQLAAEQADPDAQARKAQAQQDIRALLATRRTR